ncbi:MAG: hypothetical protein ACUVV6_04860 [Thermoplasmatota archaeon]
MEKREVTPERVEELEEGLRRVQGRLDGLELAARNMEGELREMRSRIGSIESSVREMLVVFRGLSERIAERAAVRGAPRPARPAAAGDEDEARTGRPGPGDEVVRES